jgi:hypothetical protein
LFFDCCDTVATEETEISCSFLGARARDCPSARLE